MKPANLFVEELDKNGEVDFATWCVGIVKDGIFYGVQHSSSNLLTDEQFIIVSLENCTKSCMQGVHFESYDMSCKGDPRNDSRIAIVDSIETDLRNAIANFIDLSN